MKFVMFLLVFTAMVSFNALCQDATDSDTNLAAKSGNAAKPADDKGQIKSTKLRSGHCACPGKSKAQRGCQCKMAYGLSTVERSLCIKKGIRKYKDCKNFLLKNKKTSKSIVIPI